VRLGGGLPGCRDEQEAGTPSSKRDFGKEAAFEPTENEDARKQTLAHCARQTGGSTENMVSDVWSLKYEQPRSGKKRFDRKSPEIAFYAPKVYEHEEKNGDHKRLHD